MARPKKLENAVSKSVRLPANLVDKIEEAARLRGQEFSDVLRTVLEVKDDIDSYLERSRTFRRDKLQGTLKKVRGDPALKSLLEKNKKGGNLKLPRTLESEQMTRLLDAIKAQEELGTGEELEGDERAAFLLAEMAADPRIPREIREHLGGLGWSVHKTNDFSVVEDGGDLKIRVEPDLEMCIKKKSLDDARPWINRLWSLVDRNCLVEEGMHNDRYVYALKLQNFRPRTRS